MRSHRLGFVVALIAIVPALSFWMPALKRPSALCRLNMAAGFIESPRQLVSQGMQLFRQADINGSIVRFDRAETVDPSIRPFLWQRGISYYYADRFQEGSDQVTCCAH